MSELLERERELAELEVIVREARAGSGRLAVVEAPAGLGKTRLVQAVRKVAAEAGMQVLAARATELERDFPFALVRQLFEPQLTALAAPERDALLEGASATARDVLGLAGNGRPRSAGDTFAVLHGLYWLTATLAERRPLLLAIDDAHWADAASIDYLSFLLPRLEELPVLVVVACRPNEAGAGSGLAQIATDGAAQRLTPTPLSREATTALLALELGTQPAPEFATTCHEVSGGNPFLLTELAHTVTALAIAPAAEQARVVRELAPERVTRTVLVRLARLPPQAQAVARALAVLGDDSDHRLVAELAGLDVEATLRGADALRGAAIFDAGAPLRFIHPLVRNALYVDLPAGERAALHARAATLLRAAGAGVGQIAAQLVASEPRGERETVETLLGAGSRALASGAPHSAVAYLMRALREPPPEDLRPAVLEPLITASLRAAEFTVFPAIEADVFAALRREPALLSRWAIELTPWMAINGRYEETTPLLERAAEVALAAGDVDRAVQIEGQLCALLELPPAATRARLARYRDDLAPDSASERLVAAFDAAWMLFEGSAAEAVPLARQALRGSRIFGEQPQLLAPGEVLRALVLADELDAAQAIMDEAVAMARERGALFELGGDLYLRGHVGLARGELAAAEADVRQTMEMARLRNLMPMGATLVALLVTILLERGELAAADAALEASGMTTEAIAERSFFAPLLFARGRLRLAQGRPRQAAEDLVELHRSRQLSGTAASPIMQVGAHAALALAALGERERACELVAADLAHAGRWGAPTAIARALRAQGLVVGGATGLEHLRQAAALLEGSPAQLERACALGELGAALRRAKHRAEAREPLREALELARRCGAAGLAKRMHDELAASGEKVRRYAPLGVESLTPSERRVAEMAASDMTNRQIAQALFVTVKTIETHLGSTYDKLGIRSRQQLAGALGERTESGSPAA